MESGGDAECRKGSVGGVADLGGERGDVPPLAECLALKVARSITSEDVLATLADLFAMRDMPQAIRSNNGRSSSRRRFKLG